MSLILSISILSVIPFSNAVEYSPQNLSIRLHITNNPGMVGDTFWTILNENKGTLVTSSNNGVIVIRFDFQDHEKCYDTPNTFCLVATITETKNSYFTKVGDQATIILEFPDKLTFSILSGELVTNTFDLDIIKMTKINQLKQEIDSEPLPSWNNGNSKKQIIEFVELVTNSSSSGYVPPENRIATFDNDGTLWIEQPLYIPFGFHLEYLYEQLDEEPTLSSQSPYTEILEKGGSITNEDLEHISGLTDILLPAYPNITQEEYLQKSKDYLDNTKHVRYNVALKELTYQPMVELIHYLQENDFKVYIVSAGFQGMMRAVSEEIYNIEKENVIGTYPKFISQLTEQGLVLIRQPILDSFNDGAEKPVNIQKIIGKTPIFACGNSGGDIEMLMLTQNHENHFACMLDHDDESREYYYPNQEALDESQKNGWVVISMKNDFKTIFS